MEFDYLGALRRWWALIAAVGVLAAAVMWWITPGDVVEKERARSYTATATLLVTLPPGSSPSSSVTMDRLALFVTTGEVPKRAAAALDDPRDPAVVAAELTVKPDSLAQAITIAARSSDADEAVTKANTFAEEAVRFFKKERPEYGSLTVSLLQAATPIADQKPWSRLMRTGVAGLVGLLVGLAIAVVRERFDQRLRTRDDIEAAMGLEVLAPIPRLTRQQRRAREIAVSAEPLSFLADAYRGTRSSLLHARTLALPVEGAARLISPPDAATTQPQPSFVLLVTSALAGEGKTTSVANLAAAFAETGQRVLVLDADFRSPDVNRALDVPDGAGLSDYLTDPSSAPLGRLIRPTRVPGVQLITAGTRLERPETLTNRMQASITAARDVADVILIDSAPMLAASDTLDLLPMVDNVLLVVRSGRINVATGQRTAELLARFRADVSGVLLIAPPKEPRSSYGYGYGYGHGYGTGRPKGLRQFLPAWTRSSKKDAGYGPRGAQHSSRASAEELNVPN